MELKTADLIQEYRESKMRMEILENKLNHCSQGEVDELVYALNAEELRFGRLKRELVRDFQEAGGDS